jgi:hypothetical protein
MSLALTIAYSPPAALAHGRLTNGVGSVSVNTPAPQKDPRLLQLELARVRQLLPATANIIRDAEPERH